ncbi:MAG: hypothetical protein KAH93_02090 [Candidatus Aenigmarchaeota archaeon]|nr:hypothetical protein [Candidatus Aenigmarchaeota archaeon]
MVSITIPMEDKAYSELERFPWVNWSEVARVKLRKREIFEKYIKTGTVCDEDWEFCEKIDWHPVDELPLKQEFVEEVKAAKKEPSIRLNSVADIFE